MVQAVRCAVIGSGQWAALAHLPGLQSHPAARVVLVCGRRIEAARALAGRFAVAEASADVASVLDRSDIDAVTIATPNHQHAAQVLHALAGGKHVFCEKPLGLNAAESRAMRDAARRSGRIHLMGFTYRYTRSLPHARRLLQEGAIGTPRMARIFAAGPHAFDAAMPAGWRQQSRWAGSGVVGDMGSHYFDVLQFLLEPVSEVCGQRMTLARTKADADGAVVPIDTEESASVFWRTPSGLVGEWTISRLSPVLRSPHTLEVVGDAGWLALGLDRGQKEEILLGRPGAPARTVIPPGGPSDGQPHALGRMMRAFVDAILRGAPDPAVDATFEDGHRVQLALDAVLESDRDRRWVAVASPDDAPHGPANRGLSP